MITLVDPGSNDTAKLFNEDGTSVSGDPSAMLKSQVIPYSCVPNERAPSFTSYCFVALNYIRLVWKLETGGVTDAALLQHLISRDMIEDAEKITHELQGNDVDMCIEDLLKIPIFEDSIVATVTRRALASTNDGLEPIFLAWFSRTPKNVQAILLSRPQEIILCLHIPLFDSGIYALVDLNAHTDHPDHLSVRLTRRIEGLISYIELSTDHTLLNTPIRLFDVHCLEPMFPTVTLDVKESTPRRVVSKQSLDFVVSESACTSSMRSEANYITGVSCKPSTRDLPGPRIRRLSSVSSLSSDVMVDSWLESVQRQSKTQLPYSPPSQNELSPMPKSLLNKEDTQRHSMNNTTSYLTPLPLDEDHNSSTHISLAPLGTIETISETVNTSVEEESTLDIPSNIGLERPVDSWQLQLAQQLQEEEEISMILSCQQSQKDPWLIALQKISLPENLPSSSVLNDRNMIDWQLAVQLQQEVDIGSVDISERSIVERGPSIITIEVTQPSQSFECGVCGDIHSITDRIILSDCGHSICKECLTTFTQSKINEGRYPIFCPECIADRPRAVRTQISEDIIQQLDIMEEQLNRLQELQLVSHCITIECPRCKETMNVDRAEFSERNVLVCPLPRCGHKWCKSCHKTLASSQDRHRCKNSNIERLMKRKGWKYCPGCRTPVQKETGCNHMTCGTPGCNVHFCYKCGALMIDTTNGGDVGTAVTEHYEQCRLFERKWKCTIQ